MADEGELRSRLGRALVSFSDIREARASLRRLQELNEFDDGIPHKSHDFVAHSTCLVVAYCRPFGKNRSATQNASQLPDEYLASFTTEERALHGRIKDLRDSEFAHADGRAQGLQYSIQRSPSGNVAMPVHRVLRKSLTREEARLLDGMIGKIFACLSHEIRDLPNLLTPDDGVPYFQNPPDVS
jgi:hypothetical protein